MFSSRLLFLILFLGLTALPAASRAAELPDSDGLRAWISEMKTRDRGPFKRLRWFCKDGTIHPPKPYPCKERGNGGVQHGEWSDITKRLRQGDFAVANIMADLDVDAFLGRPDPKDWFNQHLIEQFLIAADNGWIYRKAQFYRGARQEEDERAGARALLLRLLADPAWIGQHYTALRSGARLLSHGADTKSVAQVRQISAALSDKDGKFKKLRNKIHGSPDASDAAAVRNYAAGVTSASRKAEYENLAALIDAVYDAAGSSKLLSKLVKKTGSLPDLQSRLADGAQRLGQNTDAAERYALTAALLAALREALPQAKKASLRLDMIDASLALEGDHFTAATELRAREGKASRQARIAWLQAGADGIYGTGLITRRQRQALGETFSRLNTGSLDLASYKDALHYLALVPGWGGQWLRFHFQDSMHHYSQIEPLAELFIQDQLRGSPLFFYARTIDLLLRDANRLAGVRNELLGENVGGGLRSLNPGLARGRLSLAGDAEGHFDRGGIYLLPETVSELPPVAGILTAGEGNPLSHVQLLARNLGIPNVAIDERIIPKLKSAEGQMVIMAVSPAGSVRLARDDGQSEALFGKKGQQTDVVIRPDLEKLDLTERNFIPMSQLRADDSGRTVGPKAAKLGELKHSFPEAVAEGLTIPFGIFRELLDQPYDNSGVSVYDWMVGQYRAAEKLPAGSSEREAAQEAFRKKLYDWIAAADPGEDFRRRLRQAMTEVFGPDGSYGVFVRSDTNVEDLPGFTGAGLNLTVPNVVGVDKVIRAVSRVWASPFTARAFSWRQSLMDQPEHVYPAVLLLLSVPAEKSGVLVTQDIDSGDRGGLSVAVNEGVGGAVDGQAAESLRIDKASGKVKLLAQATATIRRRINPKGGVDKIPVSDAEAVLQPGEIRQLIALADELPKRFPAIIDAAGKPAPADIEFGFLEGKLRLFQIRPFLESAKARGSDYLKSLDSGSERLNEITVNLMDIPPEGS